MSKARWRTGLGALVLWIGASAERASDPIPEKVRDSVDRAVVWLLSSQNRDGSWGDNPGFPGEVGNTCIATLALLSTGSTLTRGPYCMKIRRAVDWLRFQTRGYGTHREELDGATLLERKLGPNIDLYLSALLYSQVLGLNITEPEEREMQAVLRRMTDRIASLQKSNGEWETSYEPMLTTISAWMALRQAHDAGVAIQGASAEKVVEYLKNECFEPSTGYFREAKWQRAERFVTQAGALRVLYGMGLGRTAEVQKATRQLTRMRFDQDVGGRSGGEEFLGALFATQALYVERDETFDRWYAKIAKALMACQNADGSWMGHHCVTGRVFCTAASILTMLTPDKTLPMIER